MISLLVALALVLPASAVQKPEKDAYPHRNGWGATRCPLPPTNFSVPQARAVAQPDVSSAQPVPKQTPIAAEPITTEPYASDSECSQGKYGDGCSDASIHGSDDNSSDVAAMERDMPSRRMQRTDKKRQTLRDRIENRYYNHFRDTTVEVTNAPYPELDGCYTWDVCKRQWATAGGNTLKLRDARCYNDLCKPKDDIGYACCFAFGPSLKEGWMLTPSTVNNDSPRKGLFLPAHDIPKSFTSRSSPSEQRWRFKAFPDFPVAEQAPWRPVMVWTDGQPISFHYMDHRVSKFARTEETPSTDNMCVQLTKQTGFESMD